MDEQMTVKLNKNQLEVLLQIVNKTQISGADAEFVASLKVALASAKETKLDVSEEK
jgi:hypothetical protein